MSLISVRSGAGRRRGPVRIVAGIVATLVATVAGLMFSATAAFAHHPEVTATIECRGLVSFTSTAWSTTDLPRRINASIGVSYSTNGGTSFTALPSKAAYHYGADNGYSFSDTFQLPSPLPATVIVKVTALAGWGPSGNLAGAGDSRQTLALTRPTCPAVPLATIAEVDCATHGSSVTLGNGGEDAVTFTVTKGNQLIDTVTVPGGATITKTYPLDEDQTATFKVAAPGMDDVIRTLTRNCEQPHADATVSCLAGGASLSFDNQGDSPTTFTVLKGQAQIDHFTVVGHDHTVRTYPMHEDETATFTVTSPGGMTDVVTPLTFDCQRPSAMLSANDCSANGTTATLSNDGELPVTFTIRKGDTIIDTVEVAGRATETRTYPLHEDETATFTISAPGMIDVTRQASRNCEHPSAHITDSCTAGGAVVSVANDGASTTTFTARKNGHVIDTIDVAARTTAARTYPLNEDETATFTVSSTGGMADIHKTITHNCHPPVTPPNTPPVTQVAPAVARQTLGTTDTSALAAAAAGSEQTLPLTGSEPAPLTAAGLGLLCLGGLLVRRNRTHNT